MIAALGAIGLSFLFAGIVLAPFVYSLLCDLYDEDEW